MNKYGFLTSGANQLSYVYSSPKITSRTTGILFIHADQGNRLGPHRMFVELASNFVLQGYSTFRFDLRGCGDSTGDDSKGQIKQDTEDAHNAAKFFQKKFSLKNIMILGISRGARVAYELTNQSNLPITGLMLLSTPCSNRNVALKNIQGYTKQYANKLFSPHHLKKLLRGKINIVGIAKTLTHAWKLKSRYSDSPVLNKNKCALLFIYGQCDPICDVAINYYRQHHNSPTWHMIKGANHSFFHYRWKEEIIHICKEWLRNHA